MTLCNKLWFSNPYIFGFQRRKFLKFQTMTFVGSKSLKYQRFTTLGSKDIGIRKSEFVAKSQFLSPHYILLRLSPRFKKFGKIRLGSKLSLGLIYDLSFWIQAASYFPQSWVKKKHTQHWALFSAKTNQGRFYFYWV